MNPAALSSFSVLLDPLAINCCRVRRFYRLDFDGTTFPRLVFERVEGDVALKTTSAAFLRRNQHALNLRQLPLTLLAAVRKGELV